MENENATNKTIKENGAGESKVWRVLVYVTVPLLIEVFAINPAWIDVLFPPEKVGYSLSVGETKDGEANRFQP